MLTGWFSLSSSYSGPLLTLVFLWNSKLHSLQFASQVVIHSLWWQCINCSSYSVLPSAFHLESQMSWSTLFHSFSTTRFPITHVLSGFFQSASPDYGVGLISLLTRPTINPVWWIFGPDQVFTHPTCWRWLVITQNCGSSPNMGTCRLFFKFPWHSRNSTW
jgi:hypothetical protein